MQRFYETIRDSFGNPAAGVAVSVYDSGTSTLATLYAAGTSTDSPSTVTTNPVVSGSDGVVSFAVNDGDYDLVFSGSSITTQYRYRVNFFDSTTATTIPVSSIALSMPTEFSVSGSPGTSITVTKATEASNTVWAGPSSGAAAQPAFRALVKEDLNTIAVDLTTNQSVAGNKTFTGTTTFSTNTVFSGPSAFASTVSLAGDTTMGSGADLVFDKTSKSGIGAVGTYGWKKTPFLYGGETGAGTAPTITVLQSGLRYWAFSAAATNEVIRFLSLPFDYAEGTDIYPYVTWTTGGTNTGVARFGMEYTFAKGYSQATLPANSTIYVETAGSGIALRPVTSEWSAITGTDIEPDTILLVRFFRDGAHANDTQSDTTFLLDFGIHYQSSRPFGSKNKSPNFYT